MLPSSSSSGSGSGSGAGSGSGSGAGSGSGSGQPIRAPVFGDPAAALRNQLQSAMLRPSSGQLSVVNTTSPNYVQPVPQRMTGLSPAQIAQHNYTIQRLEKDWMKMYQKILTEGRSFTAAEEKELRRIILAIRNHLRDFVGTSSKYVDEMERVMNGYVMDIELEYLIYAMEGGRQKQRKSKKPKKTKKVKKSKKSKKSRRYHSKST